MGKLARYRRREDTRVVAVQLRLETDGFVYHKWDADQRCKSGDWLVDNEGEVYTIEADTFARTYQNVGPGLYEKVATVWAEKADAPGAVPTQEGETHYAAGDYLVYEDADRRGGYAIGSERFHSLYESMDGETS